MSVINKQAYGVGNPIFGVQQKPIVAEIDPGNQKAELGTLWINKTSNAFWVLTSVVAGVANWTNSAGGAGVFTSITVAPGDITVVDGNINVNIGSISAGGDITAGNAITAQAGDIVATLGDIAAPSGNLALGNDSISDAGANILFTKSRAAGIITSGDGLGTILFGGNDGVSPFEGGAGMTVISTGTIGVGRVPAFMVFATTPDAVSAPQDRVIIPADGGMTIETPTTATSPYLTLGTIKIYTGAGAPANGLAIEAGDLYIRTDPAGATSRMYIATAANAWTNVTCAA